METSIQRMAGRMTAILSGTAPTLYLFGSVVMDDYKPGWSDIDILCLTETPVTPKQADTLLTLRQVLLAENPGNPYFRAFEGGILRWQTLLTRAKDPAVYWGTSGQRITDSYVFDVFSTISLKRHGRLLFGPDYRERIQMPSQDEIVQAVARHLETIRKHAQETAPHVYSCGWLLDIARCLYTLDTFDLVAKTRAGEWALEKGFAPEPEVLRRAVEVRKNPERYGKDADALAWMETLGPHIQRFADVLEEKLAKGRLM